MLELAQELYRRGHIVTVITTWPEYNLDQTNQAKVFDEFAQEDGIGVIRIKTLPHHNVNYFLRGLAQLIMPWQFLKKIKQYAVKPDAVVVYSPPLPLAMVGTQLKKLGARFLLNVQDLFPQNAIDLGILRNPLQIKLFQTMERNAYKHADIVTVHSEGNQTMLLQQHPALKNKLKILHNWVDLDHHNTEVRDPTDDLDFREKWAIRQRFVAVFAGVMGPSQYLDLILDVATQMQDREDLLFLLVGDGKEKKRLQQLAESRQLNNVRFENFISRADYPFLLKTCSIGLVCLSPENKTPVVPGKILGHMATGLPIAAFLHTASDGHKLIADAGCGFSAESNDLNACVGVVRRLMDNCAQFKEIGKLGQAYALRHFSKEVCVSALEEMISSQ